MPQSTALIVGSIIGVGIFSLPYSLASYGPISILAMALATVGATALALMFAVMSRRLPVDGGPYSYARVAFGNGIGFANAWLYWITAWAGNAAIAVGWVFYVQHFLNKGGATGWSIVIALAGLWIAAGVNLTGVRNMGTFQLVTSVLKFVPLALMAAVGFFHVKSVNFSPWNTSGNTNLSAIGGAMAICLFSYLVALVALLFSLAFIYWSRNSGEHWYMIWGPFLMAGGAGLVGVLVYFAERGRMTVSPGL